MKEVTKQHQTWDWLFFVLLTKSLGIKPRFKNKTKTEEPEKNHVNLFQTEPHHCPYLRFTPDFTASRVIRELKFVTTSGSEFVFVLNASLPYHMLAACAEALPRPNWELALYIIISGVMRQSVFLQDWLSLTSSSASHFSQGWVFQQTKQTPLIWSSLYTGGTVTNEPFLGGIYNKEILLPSTVV